MENLPVLISFTMSGPDLILRIDLDGLCDEPSPSPIAVMTFVNCRIDGEGAAVLKAAVGRTIIVNQTVGRDERVNVECHIDYSAAYVAFDCETIREAGFSYTIDDLIAKSTRLARLYQSSEDGRMDSQSRHTAFVDKIRGHLTREIARLEAKGEFFRASKPETAKILEAERGLCERLLRLLEE